ncbi:MAG: DUF305 domain-containing protein [Streptosporangiales bacterium]|nr:DUF305 domain-containing protein [Streptosporangiales bacterium]
MKRLLVIAAVPLAAVLTLAGCGGTDGDTTSGDAAPQRTAAQPFSDADVTFAQGMIPHHRQAIEMAGTAADRAANPRVKTLATDIEKAQGPEIEAMTGWLRAWGEDVPDDMSGMDHEGMDMPGTMSPEDMRDLERATGAEFDRMFLRMMIEHHEGAIDMARTEQADGENSDAVALAKKIERDQTAEIASMRKLLGAWR